MIARFHDYIGIFIGDTDGNRHVCRAEIPFDITADMASWFVNSPSVSGNNKVGDIIFGSCTQQK